MNIEIETQIANYVIVIRDILTDEGMEVSKEAQVVAGEFRQPGEYAHAYGNEIEALALYERWLNVVQPHTNPRCAMVEPENIRSRN